MIGGPTGDIADVLFSPSMGMLAGGVAALGIAQKFASQAKDIGIESAKLGSSSTYYQNLAVSAHKAGLEMGTVVGALSSLQQKATAARQGGIAEQTMFAGLGLSREDLERGADDTEYLARRIGNRPMTAGQKVQAFGSVQTANAVMGTQNNPSLSMSEAERQALEKSRVALQNVGQAALTVAGRLAMGAQIRGTQVGEFLSGGKVESAGEIQKQTEQVAEQNALNERGGKLEAAHRELAGVYSAQVETPYAKRENQQRNLVDAGKYMTAENWLRKEAQIDQEFLNAVGPYASARNQLKEQLKINSEQRGAAWRNPAEQTLLDRKSGNELTDYAESITRSGSLAGAYDVNSVGGYSQMVGAEYGMSQSTDTVRMVELLVRIAENTGNMKKDEGDAIISQLGYRTNDPILGGS